MRLLPSFGSFLTAVAVILTGLAIYYMPGGGGVGTVHAGKERGLAPVAAERVLPAAKAVTDVPTLIQLAQAASGLGALAACEGELYDSPVLKDSVARHIAIRNATRESGDQIAVGIANAWAVIFMASLQSRQYRLPVNEGVGQDMRVVSIETVEMKSEAACKAVEADVLRWRAPGGILDVAPHVAGQDA